MTRILFLLTVLILLLGFFLQSNIYLLKKEAPIQSAQRKLLVTLAIEALKTKEVPVSSILTFNGKIIGKGYNTVLKDTNVGGHAEINAISDAIKNIGFQNFNQLNRDSLKLITTYEPCMMCKGAIIENRITTIEFIKEKELLHWVKNNLKALRYEIRKQKINENSLQDSLFLLHPNYVNED